MPHFDTLVIYNCGKHCEKRRNCLLPAISPFLPYKALIHPSKTGGIMGSPVAGRQAGIQRPPFFVQSISPILC